MVAYPRDTQRKDKFLCLTLQTLVMKPALPAAADSQSELEGEAAEVATGGAGAWKSFCSSHAAFSQALIQCCQRRHYSPEFKRC